MASLLLAYALVLLLLAYALVLLLGGSVLIGTVVLRLTRNTVPKQYTLPLGFALLPVLVTYGGFLGIWRIPWFTEIAGVCCSAAGVVALVQAIRSKILWGYARQWHLWGITSVVLLLLLWTKWEYLRAGISHGDELRSVTFVTTFANNALKPAYLFDTSLPVAYPFYLFQSAAFAYRAVAGALYPTVPLLAATLIGIALFYRTLYLASVLFFGKNAERIFILASAILTITGLQSTQLFLGERMPYLFVGIVQPITANMHAGYHYLWGIGLAMLALAHLWQFLREGQRRDWILFALLLCLAFGNAGIPILWMIIGITVFMVQFCVSQKWLMKATISALPLSIACGFFVLLPQIFNFLPRIVSQFAVSPPHFWYPSNVEGVITATGSSFAFLKSMLFGPAAILRGTGIFVLLSLPLSVILIAKNARRGIYAPALYPLCVLVVSAMAILTFTESVTSDWFARGFIGTAIIGAFVMAAAIAESKRPWLHIGVTIILVLHLVPFSLEWTSPALPNAKVAAANTLNTTYPLGTTFYSKEYGDLADAAVYAGRQVITRPPDPLLAYFLHPETYENLLHLPVGFQPCKATWFGKSTPQGWFVNLDAEPFAVLYCPPSDT